LVWGSLTSPWLDDCACWFGGLLTCACLVDHHLVSFLLVSWRMLSHYGVVAIYSFIMDVLYLVRGVWFYPPKGLDDG
jgi:hypothetical protein